MTTAVQVQIPAAYQFLFERKRYKGAYSGRGAAKSWSFAEALLILGAGGVPYYPDPLRIACCRETQKSIADSVHALLEDRIKAMDMQDFYEIQNSAILGRNGTQFLFKGLRQLTVADIKSLEGVDIAWVEEAQVVSKKSWEILIPTIRKRGSEIWLSWNPESELDDTHKRFVVNPPPDSVIVKTSWRDNPWFAETTMPAERDHLFRTDPKAYEHVWEGEPKGAVEGAIFAAEMIEAAEDKRITSVPYDRTRPVDTFWDLGYGDDTAVWFAQAVNGYYHLIDYIQAHGKEINWYVIQLQQRGYVYGTDYLPHDGVDAIIHKKLAGDRSRSIEQIMRSLGRKVRVIPKLHVADQINAARMILPQCRFDETNCSEGLKALRSYQYGPPTALGVARREPLHDWASHGASAFCGFSVTMKQPKLAAEERKSPPRPPVMPGPYTPFG